MPIQKTQDFFREKNENESRLSVLFEQQAQILITCLDVDIQRWLQTFTQVKKGCSCHLPVII